MANIVSLVVFVEVLPCATAIRELLRYGFAAVGAVPENAGVKSGDYGVLKAPKGVGRRHNVKLDHIGL